MTDILLVKPSTAESVFHLFTAACYLLPLLGGWLADNVLGKYKVVLYLSVFYCLGIIPNPISAPHFTHQDTISIRTLQ